jgi:cytochrome o ubiquinol oxidase subunit 2
LSLLPALLLLSACHAIVLHPFGDVAARQGHLLVVSMALMLLIVVPVMALTVLFAWRYRAGGRGRYEPDWDHATHLELLIWAAPLLIIISLGALTWVGTHLLDPFRPIARIAEGRSLPRNRRPLEVQVVALDWKWLFIYPREGIATVNELAAPLDTPLRLAITSSSVMNSFYAPALAGQVYAMPGMQTQLHAVINRVGDYQGFSANYSGAGFSGMRFRLRALPGEAFGRWVAEVRAGGGRLDRAGYLALTRPSENEPVHRYAAVDPELYGAVLAMCVEPGRSCTDMITVHPGRSRPRLPASTAPLRGAGLAPPPLSWFGSRSGGDTAANLRSANP